MTWTGWAQIALVLALVTLAAIPLGAYMARVVAGERVWLSPALRPLERGCYAACGVDPGRSMGWKEYAVALMLLQAVHFLLLYLMLRLQYYLPFNPQHIAGMSPRLAFNTAMSFVTNTNWQAYTPETQISYGSQMLGLTVHNFLSAATGIAAAVAVSRAFAGGGLSALGNVWADLTRITLYVLLPITVLGAIFLIWQGVPDTLANYAEAHTLAGGHQTIALGPVAFQEVIKLVGTNGGGFFNANSAHPFENPTPLSNLLETWSEIVIPFALALTFGHIVKDVRQGWALFAAMGVILLAAIAACYAAEAVGNPLLAHLGVDPSMGNMEGKEVRFGVPASALFAATTTGTSDGAVIAMHDSFTPLGGMIPMVLIQLAEVTPGGVGSGLYGMIGFALLAVFVAGLMVGRTPEYLGKKVQAKEMKLVMLAFLILPLCILGGAALSLVLPSGVASLNDAGPHGLSEMLYGWTSATGNNGSAFAGLSADTPLLDFGLGLAMLLGRFAFLIPILAIAGSLAAKPKLPEGAGTFPTHGPLFIGLLVGVILIMGGLQFMPALSLGPLAEHFAMLAGKTY
ncbi:MAG TPA: potassium-transporting ATPase subunit KdpA [Acetobacteraceae bacterium]|nr:potassium-transporting ATPase subunit KdpA [Acetobacteraceae bacterium]